MKFIQTEVIAIPKYKFTQEELERIIQNKWLTDREREVFLLFYQHGWEIEDIAAELDVNRRTVDRTLRSIREKIKCR